MKANLWLRLALTGGIVATVTLAGFLLAARARAASLHAEIATLRAVAARPPLTLREVAPAAGTASDLAATQAESAEGSALLEAARKIPELALCESALRVIQYLKARNARMPPPARVLPPPVPKNAPYFGELVANPEYLQLLKRRWQLTDGSFVGQRLEKAGIPEALRARVLEIEFEQYAAMGDLRSFVGETATDRAAAFKAFETVRRENEAPLRELLGDTGYVAYRRAPVGSMNEIFDSRLEPLVVRSSILGASIDPATRQQLLVLLQPVASSGQRRVAAPHAPEFVERARAILAPTQMVALEELAAEYQAALLRRKLPKSSELPRTTRRQKADPGG